MNGRVDVRGRGGLLTFTLATVLASLQLAGSCVEGVTPDCSDAAVCAPSSGDAAPTSDGSAFVPEAAPSDGGSSIDSTTESDAGADADGE